MDPQEILENIETTSNSDADEDVENNTSPIPSPLPFPIASSFFSPINEDENENKNEDEDDLNRASTTPLPNTPPTLSRYNSGTNTPLSYSSIGSNSSNNSRSFSPTPPGGG